MNEHGTCSQQIEKLSPKRGDLLVVSTPFPLKAEQREKLTEILKEKADRLDCELLVLEAGVTAQLQPSVNELLAEQKKQTALLERMVEQQSLLIQALAEEVVERDPEAPPMTYMDGTPCR